MAEYNDVDARLLRKAADSGLDAFICDANEVLDLKLVRESKDVDDDETTFNPEMSHQVYGENETIFGYKDLKIKLYYSAARLTTYLNVSYSSKVKHDGVEADDIRTPLLERIPAGFLENLDDFRAFWTKKTLSALLAINSQPSIIRSMRKKSASRYSKCPRWNLSPIPIPF